MAGNLVKWWKHKILGGYKQFSVQECTTDSEELMYHQVRASSSCSAPPDLLLVSDRENNIPLRSPVVNIMTTPPSNATGAAACSSHKQQQQQQHHQAQQLQQQQAQQQQPHGTKDISSKHLRISSKNNSKYVNTTQQHQPHPIEEDIVDAANLHQQTQHHPHQHQQHTQSKHHTHHGIKEERIRLEEFTCDVSVEGGKSSQPLQFSFTFYDLDGHHGKITKDDIVGIVYTIYESIGKSVVVPHCGSKTINVRLTVSPEGKTKTNATASKLKKMPTSNPAGMLEHAKNISATAAAAAATSSGGHARRQHRYRPRKLIKSDDEDDDSNSEKEKDISCEAATTAAASTANGGSATTANVGLGVKGKSHASKYNKMKVEQCCQRSQDTTQQQQQHTDMSTANVRDNCQHDNTYENMLSLKCCTKEQQPVREQPTTEECRTVYAQRPTTDIYMKQASNRVKMLRRARKQKYQDHCIETRQRSLSVGNETCWKNRHLIAQQQQQQQASGKSAQQQLQQQQQQQEQQLGDVVDGVQLRNPAGKHVAIAQKRNSSECWKTALNRNDLISIIRESMEKNRLCFQLNGKPQANVSPIRQPQNQQQQHQQQQRQRSNTVSKIPTLIANHSNSSNIITPNNQSSTNNNNELSTAQQQQQQPHQQQQQQQHDNNSIYHPQPHIPIYHQQMAINPAVLAAQHSISAHNKINLCGYDSFLHATICGGGTSHSPPPTTAQTSPTYTSTPHQQQPIATVQPLMAVPNQQKSTKLIRSGSYATPTHAYQRLQSANQQIQSNTPRHNLAKNSNLEKSQVEQLEKWLHGGSRNEKCQKTSKDVKNYGNLIYAKLSEQLQEKEKENIGQQRRSKHNKQQQQQQQQHHPQLHHHRKERHSTSTVSSSNDSNNIDKLLNFNADPIECENLLGGQTTTDDEAATTPATCKQHEATTTATNSNPNETANTKKSTTGAGAGAGGVVTGAAATQHMIVTDTLIDLSDDIVDTKVLTGDLNAELHVHEDDDLDELEDDEDVADELEDDDGNSAAMAAANTSATSSMIHRYVHEHIHHHYHHFKDKLDA